MSTQKVEITQQMINDARQQERKLVGLKRNQFKKLIEVYLNRVTEQLLLDLNYFKTQQATDDYILVIRWILNYEQRNPLVKRQKIKKVKQVDSEDYNVNFDTRTIPSDLEIDSESIREQEEMILLLFGSFIAIHNKRADIQLNKRIDKFVEDTKAEEVILSIAALINLNKGNIINKFTEYQSKKEISNLTAVISGFAYNDLSRGIWITKEDFRVRGSHQRNHGLIRKKGEKFPNGQEYPRDMRAPIKEWINCRCILLDASVYGH